MSFNFPNAPANGQTFMPVGGPLYVFDGISWRISGATMTTSVIVSDTAPANVPAGTLWWESDTGNTFIFYDDGDSQQWVQFNVSSAPANVVTKTAEPYNRVINGAMQISQENGNTALGPTGAMASYAADQWLGTSSTSGTTTQQRVQVTTPKGSTNRIRLTINTADTSLTTSEYQSLLQYIEGNRVADFQWGTASAKQVVLRFGWKSPAGTYTVSTFNSGAARCYAANFTISAGQANTDTEQVIVIPGDTTGTWLTDTSIGGGVRFNIGAGPTYSGAAGWSAANVMSITGSTNGLATAGAVYELYDVGLYLDPDATGRAPAWQTPDFVREQALCQRYWQVFAYFIIDTVTAADTITFPVQMRVVPAFSGGGAGFSSAAGTTNCFTVYQTTRAGIALTCNARM